MSIKTPRKGVLMTPNRRSVLPSARKAPRSSIKAPRSYNATTTTTQQETQSAEEGIQVSIRMRPLNKKEESHRRSWKVLPKYSSVTLEGQKQPSEKSGNFTFDNTFGEEASTAQVYDTCVKGIVTSAVNGLNGTIFAYGQTSSGKTFTMQGSGTIQQGCAGGGGVVHLTAADIFEHIRNTPDRNFLVRASFLEIYNEDVRDLLSIDNKVLQIREDPRRGVFVKSKEEIVTDMNSLLGVLFQGEKSRAVASTAMNERSSRSHTIFRVTIESRDKATAEDQAQDDKENDNKVTNDGAVLVSTLNLVDLAGSESVRRTGATGDRQKEGAMINQR
jgi:centromeric protein E